MLKDIALKLRCRGESFKMVSLKSISRSKRKEEKIKRIKRDIQIEGRARHTTERSDIKQRAS